MLYIDKYVLYHSTHTKKTHTIKTHLRLVETTKKRRKKKKKMATGSGIGHKRQTGLPGQGMVGLQYCPITGGAIVVNIVIHDGPKKPYIPLSLHNHIWFSDLSGYPARDKSNLELRAIKTACPTYTKNHVLPTTDKSNSTSM